MPATDAPPRVTLGVSLKLYMSIAETRAWARAVARLAESHRAIGDGSLRLFVLPSLTALPAAAAELAGTPVRLGAQDLHWEDRGAFTGGVSGADLRELGCEYVEIAHAERLSVWGEGLEVARAKLAAALRNGLTPVLCVGEPFRGPVVDAVRACVEQLDFLVEGLPAPGEGEIVIAYEPVWAIGAPEAASAEHVRGVAAALREHLGRRLPGVRSTVVYGGSAQPGTLSALEGSVDGLFLGRFAHDPASFARILGEAEPLAAARPA